MYLVRDNCVYLRTKVVKQVNGVQLVEEVEKLTYCVEVVELDGLVGILIRDNVHGRSTYIPPITDEPTVVLYRPLPKYLFKLIKGLENVVRVVA